MKNVLIVDDEETLILIIESRFEDYKDQFKVLTASNGKEAIKVLESNVIDFVVTDLNMPVLDGIELLAYMSANFPTVPTIAMTAFSTPEVEEKLKKMGTLRILDKPINLDMLAHTVLKGLARSHQGGNLTSISVSNFMQLINMEQKTCVVEVHNEDKQRGFLYFNQGELYDATLNDLVGEKACYEMVAWDNVQLYLKDHPPKKARKRIKQGVMSLVLEGLRLKDESAARQGQPPPEPEESDTIAYESETEETDRYLRHPAREPDKAESAPFVNDHSSVAAELKKVNQALAATRQIGRALVSWTFDIDRVLNYGMETIKKMMNVEAGSLMLRTKNELKVAHYFNTKVKSVKKFRLKIGQGIAGHVAAKGRALIVNDARKSSRFFSAIDKQTGFKTRTVLCVPLVSKQKVMGVIQVLNKIDGDFTTGDRDCLQAIADSLSMAMEATRLYQQAVKTAENEQAVHRTL